MAKSALELYTELELNPKYTTGGRIPEIEPHASGKSGILSSDIPKYYGQRRTLMTPTDTINYNTSHWIPYGDYEEPGGFFLGMDQHDNPLIVGSKELSEEKYFTDIEADNIANPWWSQEEWIGDYTQSKDKSLRVAESDWPYRFRTESNYIPHKVYKTGEQIKKKYPDIYNKLVELGYYQ